MADELKPSRSLSEIGHLFLSSVRERQTNGAPLPRRQPPAGAQAEPPAQLTDPRDLADAIEELNWDLDRWLLVVPNPRSCEARCLLRDVSHWVLLSTCDHDGIVACYRTLKGLRESRRPRLSLAVLN